jgi:phage shock protein PspC (stress-responsive transcriptional regulator)
MKLSKNKEKGWICGVCAGIADKTELPVWLIRILFFFGSGGVIWIYLLLAVFLDDVSDIK